MKTGDSNNNHHFDPSAAWVSRSTTPPLPSGKKYIRIQLLNGEAVNMAVDVKCRVRDVFHCCCAHLKMQDQRLFGLATIAENEYRFVEPHSKLTKYVSKSWKNAPGWGTDMLGNPSVMLYLRVRVYIDFVRIVRCPQSLGQYYLQLRENVRCYWSDCNLVSEERCFEVAAMALQADFGDFDPSKHLHAYFKPEFYFPFWVLNLRGRDYILQNMPSMHMDLRLIDRVDAMVRFCREVSRPPHAVNTHLYGLRRCKSDRSDNALLGVATRGLELHELGPSGERLCIKSLLWPKIATLAFERRKFTIAEVGEQRLTFYTSSDEKSRYLLQFCKAVHQNVLALQADIVAARKIEMQEQNHFRESYIYTDEADLQQHQDDWPCAGAQRVSVVSDASSNTTSGIVSDPQHTHDESDFEHDYSPPFSLYDQEQLHQFLDSPQSVDIGLGTSASSLQSNEPTTTLRVDVNGTGTCSSDKTTTAGSQDNTDVEEQESETSVRLNELASKAEETISKELGLLLAAKTSISHNRQRSNVDIADLRQKTLGVQSPKPSVRQLPLFGSPLVCHSQDPSLTESTSTQTPEDLSDFVPHRTSTKSLATQTSGSIYGPSHYKRSEPKRSTAHTQTQEASGASYRIISAQKSFGNSSTEENNADLPSPTVVTVSGPKQHTHQSLAKQESVGERQTRTPLVKQGSHETTLLDLPTSAYQQWSSLQNLQPSIADPPPPGYNQAMRNKYERRQCSNQRRRTTVSGIDSQLLHASAQQLGLEQPMETVGERWSVSGPMSSGLSFSTNQLGAPPQRPPISASIGQLEECQPPPYGAVRYVRQRPRMNTSQAGNGLEQQVPDLPRPPPPFGRAVRSLTTPPETQAANEHRAGQSSANEHRAGQSSANEHLNLNALKSMLRGQKLPLIEALCADSSLSQSASATASVQSPTSVRPLSWHESYLCAELDNPLPGSPLMRTIEPLYYALPPPSPLMRSKPSEPQSERFTSAPNLASVQLAPPPPYPSSCRPQQYARTNGHIHSALTTGYDSNL